MDDDRAQIQRLRAEADALPHGPTQVALLEEAVRLADELQDVDLAYEMRDHLMRSAAFSGRPDDLLVAFSWCLAQYDCAPHRFNSYNLLWKYKWVIGGATHFPEIDRPRLEALLADMERRYREAGSTLHAVHDERRSLMKAFGDRAAARKAHAACRRTPRDHLSDCPACEAHGTLDYHVFQKHWRRAVQAAQPIFQKRLSCAVVPLVTYSTILLPLLHLGRIDEAREYQRTGYRLIRQADGVIEELAEHLRFVVLAGDLAQARRMMERHLPTVLESVMLDKRFAWFLAARLWTDRLLGRGTKTIKLRLPAALPSPDAQGRSDVRQLGAWFTERAQEIARRFDARNGNDYHQQRLDELPELLRLAVD